MMFEFKNSFIKCLRTVITSHFFLLPKTFVPYFRPIFVTSEYFVSIGDNLISWKSKKQNVMTRSSAEAEYRTIVLVTCELVWFKQLLKELQFGDDTQITLICDNQVALHINYSPVFHERIKNIEIDNRFVQENIVSRDMRSEFVNSSD